MKNISVFLSALVALLFSVAETSAQITPPYYNPANVRITGGTINGATVGETTPANATASRLRIGASNDLYLTRYAAKQIMISGDGIGATTNAGLIAGYAGVSSYGALWASAVTPTTSNYALQTAGNITTINSTSSTRLSINDLIGFSLSSTLNTSANPLSVTDATDSSSTTTGSLRTAGGLGVVKKAYFGDSLNVAAPGTISVGSGSTTSAGLIFGHSGVSGSGAAWSTAVTPSTTNYALATGSGFSALNNTSSTILAINGNAKLTVALTSITYVGDMIYDKTITAGGTTGAQTINKTTGRVNFAAAAASLVVTNSLVTANSIVHCTVATNDTTMKSASCVPAAGSFTIRGNANPTAETAVAFTVTN